MGKIKEFGLDLAYQLAKELLRREPTVVTTIMVENKVDETTALQLIDACAMSLVFGGEEDGGSYFDQPWVKPWLKANGGGFIV